MVTSPNYPDNYPNNFMKIDVVQVEIGKILRLEFTHFEVQYDYNCADDYVKITDGDGTTLMDKSCGFSSYNPADSYYFLPPSMTTRSNKVEILFFTDGDDYYYDTKPTGWSLSWSAVTPGEKALLMLNTVD